MYWFNKGRKVYDSNGHLVEVLECGGNAAHLAEKHNKAIRQLAQREVTASAHLTDMAIANLEERCEEVYGVSVGNEIHLQRGDDGWWYATTKVDTLGMARK